MSHGDVLVATSILLPEICLTGTVGRVGPSMRCIPDALFCSEKDEMLQYLYNGLMAPVGLSGFEMQPNMVSVQSFKERYSFLSGHLFKPASTFLCSGSKEDQSPRLANVGSHKDHVWLKPQCSATHKGSINLILFLSFTLTWTSYLV